MDSALSDEDLNIAKAVIQLCSVKRQEPFLVDQSARNAAFGDLYEVCFDAPERAIEVLIFIGTNCDSEAIMEEIVSGPLELVLERHGDVVIDRLIAVARKSETVKDMLCGVTSTAISESVQRELDQLCS